MTIELNGERVALAQNASVGDAIEHAGADAEHRGIAVAVDGEVVPRSAWDVTRLSEGQRVEVVGAIQGG